ncbi:hypothetical protein M918_01670 [Clostridium sp. BL8]|uniref:cysteine peptidase family C39 domain-containing protein n=1 Tax=Clostridium sp. BL8 TaxID=1354301 RepID=UPI00038A4D36|nr:cysteine peptidase family C39 domain-containing protein [Clostridium sp. BL8]EQB90215.1 hypothetical protein M918_01670 [Clostridium sp. BL8]
MKGKVRKVPYVPQLIQTECGFCCVAMLLKYYKDNRSLSQLREYVDVGRDGLSLKQLINLLNRLGFEAKAYKSNIDGLKTIKMPAIIHWEGRHFVVLERIDSNSAVIVDPAIGRRKIGLDELEEKFTTYSLVASPTDKFVPEKSKGSIWFHYLYLMLNDKKLLSQILLYSILTYLITLCFPIMIQSVIDGISTQDFSYVFSLKKNFIITSAFITYGLLLFTSGKKQVEFKILIYNTLCKDIFKHLLKLPYKFFENRSIGDIIFRIESLGIIRNLYSEKLISFFIDCGSILIILAYMFSKSIVLAVAAIVLSVGAAIIMYGANKKILENNHYEIIESSKLQTLQIEMLSSIQIIKSSGIEDDIYNKWGNQFDSTIAKTKMKRKISKHICYTYNFNKDNSSFRYYVYWGRSICQRRYYTRNLDFFLYYGYYVFLNCCWYFCINK